MCKRPFSKGLAFRSLDFWCTQLNIFVFQQLGLLLACGQFGGSVVVVMGLIGRAMSSGFARGIPNWWRTPGARLCYTQLYFLLNKVRACSGRNREFHEPRLPRACENDKCVHSPPPTHAMAPSIAFKFPQWIFMLGSPESTQVLYVTSYTSWHQTARVSYCRSSPVFLRHSCLSTVNSHYTKLQGTQNVCSI